MPDLILKRVCQSDKGTFGVLTRDNIPLCVTCEDPWLNNWPNVSCIPAGIYKCVPHNGTKYKNVWVLENVPGRSAILIHGGNNINSTRGCVLVGRYFGELGGLPAILDSQRALDSLRRSLPKTFILQIQDAF